MPTPGISLFSDFKMCNVYYADRKKCPDPLLAAGVLNEIIFIFTVLLYASYVNLNNNYNAHYYNLNNIVVHNPILNIHL